tara:strand:+ start:2235 stop:2798 length:564 start_codon:yes stop_codon:yes gene_type:complete
MTDQEFAPSTGSSFSVILLYGLIFGILSTVLQIAMGYVQINSEPSGSFFGPTAIGGVVVCFLTAFAGFLAVRAIVKEVNPVMSFGQGSLVGVQIALVITVTSVALSQVWYLIDPGYADGFIESTIANMEKMPGVPDEAIDSTVESLQKQFTLTGVLQTAAISAVVLIIVNVLTSLLAVKLFAQKDEF